MAIAKIQALAAAAADAGNFDKQIERFVADARQLAEGGLTWHELGQLGSEFTQLAVAAADTVEGASGEDKKALVLSAAGYLFDTVSPLVPLPWFLTPFRGPILRSARVITLELVGGLVETFVAKLQETPAVPAATK
jgi:hypothetical protein